MDNNSKETLEERKAQAWIDFVKTNEDVNMYSFVIGFDKGAKCEQEQNKNKFNEEEVKHIVSEALQSALVKVDLEQWFKQHIKK